jgi:uncharacterized membrane protein HdeD (DUF308 family)
MQSSGATQQSGRTSSAAMNARLARNWWAIGLRGVVTVVFGLAVILLPPAKIASLVVLFAAYIAADGAFAIIAGALAARRGERWWSLILEGSTNLAVAGVILIWPATIALPFLPLASAWAIVTGAMMLAASQRSSVSHGRWLLVIAGTVSAIWGAVIAGAAPSWAEDISALERWLVAYALLFGVALAALALQLRGEREETNNSPAHASERL